MMRQYKDDQSPQVRRSQAEVIRRLLYLGIVEHERCVGAVVGQPVSRRLAIPGKPDRAGQHPFIAMTEAMQAVAGPPEPQLVARTDIPVADREVTPVRFAVWPSGRRFDGEHILVLDDTWTTGSRTQSAALLLRQHGAVHVSVMTVARWLDRSWAPTKAFVGSRLTTAFAPNRCPVTGTACP